MALRLSTGIRNFINAGGSMKDALQGGELRIYSGTQPATADTAPSGTLLVTITNASGTRTPEVLATGTVTLNSGSSGSVDAITVNGVAILDAAVPYATSLTVTAANVAAAINSSASNPEYSATSSGAVITIKAKRGSGAGANTFAVVSTVTTLTKTDVNLSGGVTAVNGLKMGTSAGGVLDKHATQVWTGVAVATNTAGYYRFVGSVADGGGTDTSEVEFRVDGAISTSGAQLNMSNTTITFGATDTVSTYSLTLPTS
jgi:hypothetical protein